MKKLLASILAVCMLLSVVVVLPVTAAEETSTGTDTTTSTTTVPTVQSYIDNGYGYKGFTGTKVTPANNLADGLKDGVYEYAINSAAGMQMLADLVNGANGQTKNNMFDYKLYLTGDIIGTDSDPLTFRIGYGDMSNVFSGTFDGQGYMIDYWKINDTATTVGVGFFGLVVKQKNSSGQRVQAIIKNFVLGEHCSITSPGWSGVAQDSLGYKAGIGSVVGYAEGVTIENVKSLADVTVTGSNNVHAGGIIGFTTATNATIKNCTYGGDFTSSRPKCGGILGTMYVNTTISYCITTGTFNLQGSSGGIVGYIRQGNAVAAIDLSYCVNGATITSSQSRVGGIVGIIQRTGYAFNIRNCVNLGTISTTSTEVSGIVGNVQGQDHSITDCINYGSIQGSQQVGGIIGKQVRTADITGCKNDGSITATNGIAGGIVGQMTADSIKSCQNYGTISAPANGKSAGIVGLLAYDSSSYGDISISDCENNGEVTGLVNMAGIIGRSEIPKATIENCTNNGKVTITSGYEEKDGLAGSAGILGCVSRSATTFSPEIYLEGCKNNGEITTSSGGIAGILGANIIANVTVTDCHNTAAITGSAHRNAGILGHSLNTTADNFVKISASTNSGTIKGTLDIGGIVGVSSTPATTITSCKNLETGTVTGSSDAGRIGGIIGQSNAECTNLMISNCSNAATISSYDQKSGGIAGSVLGIGTIENCTNTGAIDGGRFVGGILGIFNSAVTTKDTPFTIINCTNDGELLATTTDKYKSANGSDVGGIVGVSFNPYLSIIKCSNKGSVTATANNAGGILGRNASTYHTISECVNKGTISGNTYVAGIVANISQAEPNLTLESCKSYGVLNLGSGNKKDDIFNVSNGATIDASTCFSGSTEAIWATGYQAGTVVDGKQSIRLIFTTNTLDLSKVNFNITVNDGTNDTVIAAEATEVYSSLTGIDDDGVATYTASDYRNNDANARFIAVVITDIPANVDSTADIYDFTVTTYLNGDTTQTGDTLVFSHDMGTVLK